MADPVVVSVIVAYFALLLPTTYYAMRRTKHLKDYYVAGRKLDTGLLTMTISGTVIGASATTAAVTLVFNVGLPGMWIDLAGGIGLILLGIFLAKKVREMDVYTLPQILEKRYSHEVRLVSSFVVIAAEIAWLALLSLASQFILMVTLGIEDKLTALSITMVIVIAYTFVGGQYAVAYAEYIQFSITVIGICFICLPVALWNVFYGHPEGTLFAGAMSFPVNSRFDFIDVSAFFFLMALPHLVGSDIYSKVFSAKDGETARRATILSGVIKIIFAFVMGALGICAILLFPDLKVPSMALPHLVMELIGPISPILLGIVIAALLATMMDSSDTVLLTAGTVFTNDIYARYIRRRSREKEQMVVSRVAIIAFGLLGFYLAYVKQDIITTLKLGYTVFTAGIILPVLVSFHKDRMGVTSIGAMAGMMAGATVSVYLLEFAKTKPMDLDPVLWGMAVCLLYMFVTSMCDPAGPLRKRRGARSGRGSASWTR